MTNLQKSKETKTIKKTIQGASKNIKKIQSKKNKENELKLLDTDFIYINFGEKSKKGGRFK